MVHRPRASGTVLLARGLVLGTATVSLAAAGHVLAGGQLPSASGMAVLLAVAAAVSLPALRVRASRLRVVVLVIGMQAIAHTALAFAGGGAHQGSSTGHSMTQVVPLLGAHSGHHGSALTYEPSGPELLQHLMGGLAPSEGLSMTLAHGAAAAILGWWLASGEQLLWSVILLSAAAAGAACLRIRSRIAPGFVAMTDGDALLTSYARRSRLGLWTVLQRLADLAVERRGPPSDLRILPV